GFCSDAIPVHLLTREAILLYFQKLAPGGVLVVHISNNHLDLPPLVARIAADLESPLAVRYCHDLPGDNEKTDGKTASQWRGLARSAAVLGKMARHAFGEKVPVPPGPVWRDDYATLLRVWKKREEN